MTAGKPSPQDRILLELEAIRDCLSHFQEALAELADKKRGFSLEAILDALSAHIALLDETGAILFTNRAWKQFAAENGMSQEFGWIGINYLEICYAATDADAPIAVQIAEGIENVIRGKMKQFSMDYPCHSPTEKRWFRIQATRSSMNQKVCAVVCHDNITGLKSSYERIRAQEEQLHLKAEELARANTALKEVLQRVETEKREVQEKIALNIQESVLPYVQKMNAMSLPPDIQNHLKLLENALLDIRSSFARDLTIRSVGLTPSERRIATLIRNGLNSKEIAVMLGLSIRAIEFHRQNIRHKLGLKNSKANLHSFLLEMPSITLPSGNTPND
ncbi:helix-turn-helix domain-containing protein [Desulfoferrobacter suflitae]|uniref:helix-turn-helix domain-containing protein n=1 Tax=Desulfoferrobacter suflitae TaxID=2865782 RepID=UPI0021642765|nr:helix-turn-helix transcriptional regulator [Desulfoferrobacter suflitae]MCK8601494.1 helix-turn-helix transcriptional regulator [Desulfoferrobacter suflitae]